MLMRLRRGPTVGVGRIYRVRYFFGPARAVFRIAMGGRDRFVDRNLLVVDTQPRAVRVRVGKTPCQQHLVWRQTHARHHIVRLERGLFDLCMEISGVAVQGQLADLDQRVVLVRPDLGQIKRVDAIGLGILVRHDLPLECPARVVPVADVVEQIGAVVIAVGPRQLVGFVLAKVGIAVALIGVEVELDPEFLALGIDQRIGVAGIPVHLAPVFRNATVAHEIGHLMRAFGRERPEIPLHIVVAHVVIRTAFLAADELLELDRIADKEDRGVVADHVKDAFVGVHLDREAARVAPCIGAATFACHG